MTKKTTLKSFCNDFLQEVLTDCNKISLENHVLKKQETQFSFKNNLFANTGSFFTLYNLNNHLIEFLDCRLIKKEKPWQKVRVGHRLKIHE